MDDLYLRPEVNSGLQFLSSGARGGARFDRLRNPLGSVLLVFAERKRNENPANLIMTNHGFLGLRTAAPSRVLRRTIVKVVSSTGFRLQIFNRLLVSQVERLLIAQMPCFPRPFRRDRSSLTLTAVGRAHGSKISRKKLTFDGSLRTSAAGGRKNETLAAPVSAFNCQSPD
jgi:hypothetical protein